LSLRLAQAKLDSDPAGARTVLAGAGDELARALDELRELARGLHPAVLTDRGLRAAVEMLAGRAPIPVEIVDIPDERLPEPVEAAAYYLIAEALTNVAKYAQASTVRVRVTASDAGVTVAVSDDGVGGADPAAGSGLRGLADRVEALGGSIAVVSRAGAGTSLRAEIPRPLGAGRERAQAG
jgi:signal transduction histidine kinase